MHASQETFQNILIECIERWKLKMGLMKNNLDEMSMIRSRPLDFAENTATTPTEVTNQQMQQPECTLPATQVHQSSEVSSKTETPRETREKTGFPIHDEPDTFAKFYGFDEMLPSHTFVKMIDELTTLQSWTDHDILAIAKQMLTMRAKKWTEDVQKFRTWKDLREQLLVAFEERIDTQKNLEILRQSPPQGDESVIKYIQRMRCLGHQNGLSDALIIQHIVDVFPGERIAKSQLYNCKDYLDLLEAVLGYSVEITKKNSDRERSSTSGQKKDH